MRKKKTELVAWVKAHRKQLLIAGISITAILGVIIGLKNKDTILDMCNSLEDSVARVPEQLPKPISVAQVTPAALEEVITVVPTLLRGKHLTLASILETCLVVDAILLKKLLRQQRWAFFYYRVRHL